MHPFTNRADKCFAAVAGNDAADHDHLRIDESDNLRNAHRQNVDRFGDDLLRCGMITENIAQQGRVQAKFRRPVQQPLDRYMLFQGFGSLTGARRIDRTDNSMPNLTGSRGSAVIQTPIEHQTAPTPVLR